MYVLNVNLSGNRTDVLVTSKPELSCFKHIAGSKKADIDERVLHIELNKGRLWATDRRLLLAVGVEEYIESEPLVALTSDLLGLLKPVKATAHVFLSPDGHVWSCAKQELSSGCNPPAEYLGQLPPASCELGPGACTNVLRKTANPSENAAGKFLMSSAFGAVINAVTKVCKGVPLLIFTAPKTETSGMRFAMKAPDAKSEWRLVAMPLMPSALPRTALTAQSAEEAAE
jgi:hypothetical protein